jgi:peptide/nickel transport system substrate-binding protein
MNGFGLISRRAFGAGLIASGVATYRYPAAAADDTAQRGGTLVATWGGGEPPSCYVPTGGGIAVTFTSSKLLERLAKENLDGSVVGVLAESWAHSDDFTSYRVKVRRGVKWHDGKDLTVEDIVFSIGNIWKKYANPIGLNELIDVEAIDSATVVVRFARPMSESSFESALIGGINYILPRHIYEGSDPLTNPINNSPIGTGPWILHNWVRGSHLEFVRNDNYWDKRLPYLDRLIIRYLRDPASRAAAMEAGEVQLGVFSPFGAPDIKRLASTGMFDVTTNGYQEAAWITSLECNMRNPVFSDRRVRQAIFHAIDRSFIAKTVFYGQARPGVGPINSLNKKFVSSDINKLEFDPHKAGDLLDAAGFKKDSHGARFSLNLVAANWNAENSNVGICVKQALEDVGIQINLFNPDAATSVKRIYTDYDFDLAISNSANQIEPIPSVTRYVTTDGIAKGVAFRNANGFSNRELDALVDRIKIETNVGARKALIDEFQKVLTQEAVYLPLVELAPVTIASKSVRNHSNNADFVADSWADLWIAS